MKKSTISHKELREFGLLVGIGFPIIVGWLIPTISGHLFKIWSLWVGIPLLLLGIIKPLFLFYPYKVWTLLSHVLGWINSRLILGTIFLLVLQPIAFIMKIFGYDPLKNKKNNITTFREIKENHKVDLNRIF